MLGKTLAISRLVARKNGYYPLEPATAFEADWLVETYYDVFMQLAKVHLSSDETKKLEQADLCFNELLPAFLKKIQPYCQRGAFLLGDRLTVADFWIGSLYTNCFENDRVFFKDRWATLLKQYPAFEAYGKRFMFANKAYLARRVKNAF